MAFEMSLPRTKRVKYINPDGTEVFQEEDSWALVRAVHHDIQTDNEANENEKKEDVEKSQPKLPIEALEKLQMARGEVSMMLDLVEMLEAQQHMGIENVQPQKSTLSQLTRNRAFRTEARALQIKDVTERLEKGVSGLKAHSVLQNRYFSNIEEMTKKWNIRPNPHFETGGSAAPFLADISLLGATHSDDSTSQIELGRSSTGEVEVRDQKGGIVRGSEAVDSTLSDWQDDLVWTGLRQTLIQEAQESTRSNAAQTLANEILEEAQNPQNNSMKELRYLLIKAYLQSIESKQKTGVLPKILPRANAWLRHRWFFAHVYQSLKKQAEDWSKTHNERVDIDELPVPGNCRSALQLKFGDEIVTLIVQVDTLEVRGLGMQIMEGNRSASSSIIPSVAKQDIGALLQRIMLHK